MEETKGCARCKKNRPINRFRLVKGKPSSWCNFCFALYQNKRKAMRRDNPKKPVTLPQVYL
jgi:hypothetical protein